MSIAEGPLSVQNHFPLHLMFLTPRPCSAGLPEQGELSADMSIDYTSVYFNKHNRQWDVLMDMETTILDLSLAYGLSRRLAFQLDAPIVSMNAGILDGFLEGYHDAVGVPNYGREERPDNTYGYYVAKNGRSWVEGRPGVFTPADATLSAKLSLWPDSDSTGWTGSLLLSLKAPTGDSSAGSGSGRYDYGVFVPMTWSGRKWALHVMPGMIRNSDPETRGAEVSAQDSYSLFAGISYSYSRWTTVMAQFNAYSSPIETTGITELDGPALEMAVGFHHKLDNAWTLTFAFCEDLTRAAPDFTVRLGLKRSFHFGK